jgi:FkbH-like protein
VKKAIIFDCDYTLWEGIVGETDVVHYYEYQSQIVFLARHGVIIGLCSKNNEKDVLDELKNTQCLLKEEYISVHRINWKDKVSNLKEIAEELNIGLDAIVMVDDSLYEVNMIDGNLPEVMAIFPEDLMKTVVDHFDLTGDLSKTRQYKENLQRARTKEQFTDISEYLRSLEMILNIELNDTTQVDRITELTQKTNQFNLTTKRYIRDQIWGMMMIGEDVYSLSVKDKFGDNGLVGVCIVHGNVIDTFLLSCRVLGRNIEFAFINYIIERLRKQGFSGVIGNYIKSEKNQQVEKFYSDCGFECINIRNETITFSLSLDNYKSVTPDYFKYE